MESRPVDGGGGGVCKKVLLLQQNGVILVRPRPSVGIGLGYISL